MSTSVAPATSSRSQAKLISFAVFFAVTIFVVYMKNRQILDPKSEIAQHFAPVKWFLAAHGFCGALALVLGAFQFSNRLRARYLKVHRTFGYIYVASVFIAAPLAIPVAMRVDSLSLVAASAAQSFGWMVTTGIALICVRRGNIAQHRRWMIRSYPFAMVFTVARVLIPTPPILRLGFTGIEIVVWSTIMLAAFLPNIFLEWRAMFPSITAKATLAAR
jgi:uncharacterized membrane protein